MTTTVILKQSTADRLKRLVASGACPDTDAVIEEALDALVALRRAKYEEFRTLVLEGHDSGAREELTADVWDRIAREADEADLLDLPISDAVKSIAS
jgi:Arc/MetJ-type ribon-helix-helix transcriptional regulator